MAFEVWVMHTLRLYVLEIAFSLIFNDQFEVRAQKIEYHSVGRNCGFDMVDNLRRY